MPRYGDLDKMANELQAFAIRYAEQGLTEVAKCYNFACTVIDNAPTADVVEVVRCKDCKHCDIGENEVDAWCDCRIFNISGSEDFYCSCGERRNDE